VLGRFQQALESLDYAPIFRQTLGDLEAMSRNRFAAESGPMGPWAPLAPATIKRKGHATILVETGRLRDSLGSRNQDSVRAITKNPRGKGGGRLRYGTARPWAALHQEGGARVPARPFVGILSRERQAIRERIRVYTILKLNSRRAGGGGSSASVA
jgi:phage gpG-like protein